jgi:hypothetical protein
MLKIGRITKRELTLLVLFIIVYTLLLMDKFIQKAYNNFNNLEQEIVLNEKKIHHLNALLNNSGELNAEYEKFFSKQSNANNFDSLLQQINSVARRLDVNILNIKPNLIRDDARYKTFSIRIESQDDIPNFTKFLHTLTNEQKNIGVERLQIRAQKKEELPRITLVLNAVTFKD